MHSTYKIELLLLMGIITVLLFKIVSSRKSIDMTQAIMLFIAIIIATYLMLFSKVLEAFNDQAIDEARVDPVLNDMTVFIASDDITSYVPGNQTWQNISSMATTNNTTFKFSKVPQAESNGMVSTKGVPTKDVIITGPPSSELGYSGETDFTIFWHSVTNTITENTSVPLFVIKGDSQNSSISIKVMLDSTYPKNQTLEGFADSTTMSTSASTTVPVINNKYPIRIVVQHSDDDPYVANTIYINRSIKDMHFILDQTPHLYMLVRDGTSNSLRLYVDNHDTPLFSGNIKSLCTLTNSRMYINPDGNQESHGWDANLYFFGIYKKALSPVDRSNLYNYINNRMVMNQPAYNKVVRKYDDAKQAMEKLKACPFEGQAFCSKETECGNIKDWTQQGILADPKNATCLQKVISHCNSEGNSHKAECLYWARDTNQQLNTIVLNTISPGGVNPVTALVNTAKANAPLISGTNLAGVANAINTAVADANSTATNTATRTANILQNVLDTSKGMDPVVYRMIQTTISDNRQLAIGNTISNTQEQTNMYSGSNINLAQLRTVGANLYNDPSEMYNTPIVLGSNISASNVAHFTDANNANVNTAAMNAAMNANTYDMIMSKYQANIALKQRTNGLLGTLTSLFI